MDRRPRWPWLLLLSGFAANAGAVPLRVDETGLSPAESTASRAIVDDALERLPESMREAFAAGVLIEWRGDLPGHVHGRAKGRRILLDRALLQRPAETPEAPQEARARDPALVAMLHELAHVYDRSSGNALSGDKRLLDLAGWQVSPTRLGLRRPVNAFTDRSPDAYELKGPAEFVAINFEYFLLDATYACRRPALHRYFAEHFRWSPPHAPCATDHVFVQPPGLDAHSQADRVPVLAIDPARVHAVDYLLAEASEQPASRWGHAMLRLVICAPGRRPGPDCRLDLRHHQVLSFRAFVDDLQLSSWRGLTGSYPSRLFVLPLQQVVDEYTRVELRGLQSIPLDLADREIATLLERAAHLHWSYDGRYAFVSNNCAVETYRLLHDALPRFAALPIASITPTGLLRKLERSRVADASVLDDASEALRLGYRFDAMSERYQSMFDVARFRLGLPSMQVRQWLDLRPMARGRWIEGADMQASAALLVLEQAALRRQELQAREELKRALADAARKATGDTSSQRTADALDRFLQLEGLLSRPALLLPGPGYGLPQPGERQALLAEATARMEMMAGQGEWLRAQARLALSAPRREALEGIEANLQALGERLRALHRQQGGVPLL